MSLSLFISSSSTVAWVVSFFRSVFVGESFAFRIWDVSRIVHTSCLELPSASSRTVRRFSVTLVSCLSAFSCVSGGQRRCHVRMPDTLAFGGFRVHQFSHKTSFSSAFASLLCAGLNFHEPLSLTLPSFIRAVTSASRCPSGHPIRKLVCVSSFLSATRTLLIPVTLHGLL